ncbi:MAG TPA: heme-binding domain-containing protein [Bryobacteraceae bacterium]|jgi:uncharacterized membrane protein|nr:heme-binding domain-containing protein [Bryobacteraceae bacterium]
MGAVSQWEREAVGERAREALRQVALTWPAPGIHIHGYLTTSSQTSSRLPHQKSMTKRAFVLSKRSILGSAVILSLTLILVTGSTSGAKTADSSKRYRLSNFDAPLPVRAIIQRACADCHSEETKWPWYSNLPPVSWRIRADIDKARALMDLSRWNEYTDEERREFASEIARSTRVEVMPPPGYLWMHRDAKLSTDELNVLKEWARH